MTYEEAVKIRHYIEKGMTALDDTEALEVPELFPSWTVDTRYEVGDRVLYEDNLYRCEQAHTAQADWIPSETKALWTNVALPHEIPVWVQPTGAQDAYNTGDKVWYPDVDTTVYESLIDANVWSPEAYPQGWEVVENTLEEGDVLRNEPGILDHGEDILDTNTPSVLVEDAPKTEVKKK